MAVAIRGSGIGRSATCHVTALTAAAGARTEIIACRRCSAIRPGVTTSGASSTHHHSAYLARPCRSRNARSQSHPMSTSAASCHVTAIIS